MVPIRPGCNLLITDRAGRKPEWIGGGAGQPRHVFFYLIRPVIVDSHFAIVIAVVIPHLRRTGRVRIAGTRSAVPRTVGTVVVPYAIGGIAAAIRAV